MKILKNCFSKYFYQTCLYNFCSYDRLGIFRAENLSSAFIFIKTLFAFKEYELDMDQYNLIKLMNSEFYFMIIVGVIASTPIIHLMKQKIITFNSIINLRKIYILQ